MKRSEGRILTTHAGALPRPIELIETMGGGAGAEPARQPDAAKLNAILQRAVPEVVKQQVDAGIDVVNDGEYGKPSWTGYMSQRLGGFETRPATPADSPLAGSFEMKQYAEYYGEAIQRGTLWHSTVALGGEPGTRLQYVCAGPITYTGRDAMQRDIDNLKRALQATPAVEAFLPVAAPASVEVGRKNEYYATDEEFVFALADAMAEEYRLIVDAGFLVQIDDAWIPALWDQMLPDADLATYLKYCNMRAEALNHALQGISPDMVRYHICWGSWHGPHMSDVPLKDILDVVLKINAGAYVIEAANVRHEHEYHLWEDAKLPDGKLLIPGVVSHSTNVVEHPDLVAERLLRFAERVGRENVLGGTDCGLGGRVHPQVAWAKMGVLVEGAKLASQKLWA
jgi:5-methyltetrahydropteroyltriglutamate--homocysteine methyltransferase